MKIITLNNYSTDENTYIVYDENTKSGFVTDPGCDSEDIIRAAENKNINIKYILITHCHYDHIAGMGELRKKISAPLVCGEKAGINIKDPSVNLSLSGLGYSLSAEKSEIILKDNEELAFDGLNIKCIYTPGHTNCSVCYLVNNNTLFSGDTLFLRSVGRSDLPTGNSSELIRSIKTRIYTLDDNIDIYCGHGKKTSVGYEKKFNLFVRE